VTVSGAEPWPGEAVARPLPADPDTVRGIAAAVSNGLVRRRKRLPPWLLYDASGSDLFEQITELREYYPTRTERAILGAHADEMIEAAGTSLAVAELGAGTASKTQLLISALLSRQPRATYMPIDVSPSALAIAAAALARYRRLDVLPTVGRYPEDLRVLARLRGRRLLLFLGSNVGNYDPPAARALLAAIRRELAPGDAFLVGADMRKSGAILLAAYDDAQGVTGRFNLNVLGRLNRELGAEFDVDRFHHVVRWNRTASRVELYLESDRPQRVPIRSLGLEICFAAGERIHTESSYKFTRVMLDRLFSGAGFTWERSWYDGRSWFGVHLLRVPAGRAARRRPVIALGTGGEAG
jgi:L-histidine Nalpha-methyltransferase